MKCHIYDFKLKTSKENQFSNSIDTTKLFDYNCLV